MPGNRWAGWFGCDDILWQSCIMSLYYLPDNTFSFRYEPAKEFVPLRNLYPSSAGLVWGTHM